MGAGRGLIDGLGSQYDLAPDAEISRVMAERVDDGVTYTSKLSFESGTGRGALSVARAPVIAAAPWSGAVYYNGGVVDSGGVTRVRCTKQGAVS